MFKIKIRIQIDQFAQKYSLQCIVMEIKFRACIFFRRFFVPLGRTHWETIEVSNYWKKMEKAGLSQKSVHNESKNDENFDAANRLWRC